MKLLALDCSTEACSVALYNNAAATSPGAGEVVAEQFQLAAREHTRRLLPMVEQVLAEGGIGLSQLDAIAFGRGPGSFTGLRIALGAVQGLAFGADLPVVPVSSLAGLAQTAVDARDWDAQGETGLVAAIDARMDEVYWAQFTVEEGLVVLQGEEQLSPPEALLQSPLLPRELIGVGSGWQYADRIPLASQMAAIEGECLPRAGAIVRLAEREFHSGNTCPAEHALPTYLRDEVAWQKSMPAQP